MPGDFKIIWNAALAEGDFDIGDGDLINDEGLETAVVISLFTDRRASDDDRLPFDNASKRGWWGDLATPEVLDDQIGSKLWLLDREKTTNETLERAKEYISEALQWMIDDGVAVSIDVSVERAGDKGNDRLHFLVKIKKSYGTEKALRYEYQWEQQFA